jgi:hypothetical protein
MSVCHPTTWYQYPQNKKSQQHRQCMYKCNIQAHLHNICCYGKAINITYSVCVCGLSYPACKAHGVYCIVICGLPGSTIFFHIISKTVWFSIKCIEHDFLKKYSNIKFYENMVNGSWVVPCRWTDGQTDRKADMMTLIVAFCNFTNMPKKLLQKR